MLQMSIVTFLGLAVLYLSFHACNGRSLGVVSNDLKKEFQSSTIKKSDQNPNPGSPISIKPDRESVPGFQEKKTKHFQHRVKGKKSDQLMIPDRKRGEQNPGFNLDYLPPKTHPPVHN